MGKIFKKIVRIVGILLGYAIGLLAVASLFKLSIVWVQWLLS